MKRKFVVSDTGVLILATEAQLADDSIQKILVEDGAAEKSTADDPIAQLTGVIKDMATDVKSAVDGMKEKLVAYQDAAQRGLFVPGGRRSTPMTPGFASKEEQDEVMGQ